MTSRRQQAFSLIELMIVIAIVGILSSIALPLYDGYTKKSKFSEIVYATTAVKTAVHICVQENNGLLNCSANSNGIPPDVLIPTGYLSSLVTSQGVIEATAVVELDNMTYKLSPTYTPLSNTTTWVVSGSCLTKNFCKAL